MKEKGMQEFCLKDAIVLKKIKINQNLDRELKMYGSLCLHAIFAVDLRHTGVRPVSSLIWYLLQ